MAEEYITKKQVYGAMDSVIKLGDGMGTLWGEIQFISPADVQPVRHARNICVTVPKHCEFKCSLCGAELSSVYGGENDFGMDGGYLKYCPNCGAKMDKED